MKKIFLILVTAALAAGTLASCNSSRKVGCPMQERMMRGA
jgi:predicted small secreted protein